MQKATLATLVTMLVAADGILIEGLQKFEEPTYYTGPEDAKKLEMVGESKKEAKTTHRQELSKRIKELAQEQEQKRQELMEAAKNKHGRVAKHSEREISKSFLTSEEMHKKVAKEMREEKKAREAEELAEAPKATHHKKQLDEEAPAKVLSEKKQQKQLKAEQEDAKESFNNLMKQGQKNLMSAQSQMKKVMNEKASEQVLKKIQNGKFEKENEEMMKKNAANLEQNQPEANTENPENLQEQLIDEAENEEAKATFDKLVKEGQADQLTKEAQLKKLFTEKGSAKALKKIETGKFAKDNADMFKQGTDLAKKIQSGKM